MSNIRTLGSVRKSDSGPESDGEDNGRQGFYVGGSETSGQQVLGPPGRNPPADMTERLLTAARAAGAEVVNPAEEAPQRARPNRTRGMRADGTAESGSESDSDDGAPSQDVRLIMWQNGFSVDDGPLREFEDPASREFLESIMQGHIPNEIRRMHPNHHINLRMEKKAEDFQAPKAKPFGGSGQRLGAVVPNIVTASSSSGAPVPAAAKEATEDLVAKAQTEISLDTAAPVTQIQARLPAGNRVVGRFNHSHTVSTVRTFLVSACPELAFTPFQLMTTFPNKVVEDESVSLKDAGLINAVVVVKPVA